MAEQGLPPGAKPPPFAASKAAALGPQQLTPLARRWRSADLFGSEQQIEIEHGQSVYRLRQTTLGKLILTK